MTDCAKIRQLLELSADGAASPEQEETVAAHLETCEDCRQYRAFLESVDEALQIETEPPEGFTGRVMDRVRDASAGPAATTAAARPANGRRYLRYGAMAACFVAVLALALILPRTLRMGRSASDASKSAAPKPAMLESAAAAGADETDPAPAELIEQELMAEAAPETPDLAYAQPETAEEAIPAEPAGEPAPETAEEEAFRAPDDAANEQEAAVEAEPAGNAAPAAGDGAPFEMAGPSVPGGYASVVLIYDTQFTELLRELPVHEENGAVYVELTPELLEELTRQGYDVVTFDGAERYAAAALIY